MNILTGVAADDFFGGEVPPATRALLHRAAAAAAEERAALLWTAQAMEPAALPIYYALYKHHAGRRELDLAERAARRGLAEAARLAGLPADWRAANAAAGAGFRAAGAARFWLFTLKALAFICLRDGRPDEAREYLAAIARVDADARVGDEVIAQLLAAGAAEPP